MNGTERGPTSCFLWHCKFAWTTRKECSKREEPTAALRLETHSTFWLMDPGTVIGTRDSVPEPTSGMTWGAKKKLAGGDDRQDVA